MNKPSEPLGLHSPDGRQAQLLSVQVQGELLGLVLRLTVRQTWRNTSGAPMATRLGFALAADQHLLELQAEHEGDQHKVSGLLRPDPCRCMATLGTLHTGQQLTLQWRLAQRLQLDGGSLRLQLPASLAPAALRPARISIELHDALAQGTVSSSSHEWQKIRHANGMTLRLIAPRGLDRDVGLSVHGLKQTAFAIASPDPVQAGAGTLLVSRSLTLGTDRTAQRLRIKLLVDHSGAIPWERQARIQIALERLLVGLRPEDQLSCSRIDQSLVHALPRLQPCTEAYVRRARAVIRHHETMRARPDWSAVLQAMVNLPDEDEEPVQDASILLITDQPLLGMGDLLPSLLASGHRLHVMTVGDAASQSDWPRLARLSDGSCETLGSGQHCQQTLQRLLDRMRSLFPVQAQLSLQDCPLEAAQQEHAFMAEGDTLHLWARFTSAHAPADLTGRPQWQAALTWQTSDSPAEPRSVGDIPVLWDPQGDIHRLCSEHPALQSVQRQGSASPALQAKAVMPLATATEKPEPALRKTVSAPSPESGQGPERVRPPQPDGSASPHGLERKRSPQGAPDRAVPADPMAALVHQFNQRARAYRLFRAALAATLPRVATRQFDGLIMQLARRAGSPARVWAVVLYWLHAEQSLPLQDHALQLVEDELASLPVALRSEVHAVLAVAVRPVVRQAA